MPVLIAHAKNLNSSAQQHLRDTLQGELIATPEYYTITTATPPAKDAIEDLRQRLQLDLNLIPDGFAADNIQLFITDMDSTLISIECVDEIADFVGKKAEVSAITEAAMRGELDFNASLTRRVALLKGLSTEVLNEVYNKRLQLNPGAETLLDGLKQRQIRTALVSGGFTFFTDKLQTRLGFDFVLSNRLQINGNNLTGGIDGDIVNADKKAQFLQNTCEAIGATTAQAIAAGDGANDLKMMHLAGLSVAYRAKPTVRAQADIQINYSGLDSILHVLHATTNQTAS
ncbi:phosphoserine phosphatase SerB [Kaarinaea lacus]